MRVHYHAQLVTTQRDGKFMYYRLNPKYMKGRPVAGRLDFGCCKLELRS